MPKKKKKKKNAGNPGLNSLENGNEKIDGIPGIREREREIPGMKH
jgi:hypothetical protein